MPEASFLDIISRYASHCCHMSLDSRYLAAVSGGVDSVVMLRALLDLGYKIEVAHCNFRLRGEESDRDENFVTELCSLLGLKLHIKHFDVTAYKVQNGASTEMACRKLRYDWFNELSLRRNLNGVIVAHNSDDQIETLWLNILRGSGIAGMAAMKPISGNILRPLLCVNRQQIEQYARQIGQQWVTDSTNLHNDYKRNRLRNVILPAVRQYFDAADKAMLHTIDNLSRCNTLYQTLINDIRQRHVTRDNQGSIEIHLSDFIQRFINAGCAQTLLFELIKPFGLNSLQATEILSAYSSAQPSGKQFLSATHRAITGRGILFIMPIGNTQYRQQQWIIDPDNLSQLPINITIETIPTTEFSPKSADGCNTVCFSTQILDANLVLRHWQKGDRFQPFGMKGTRLISDLFSDLKLSPQQKSCTWLLTANGKIAWVVGLRSSALFPVSPNDTMLVRISLRKLQEHSEKNFDSNHHQ